MPRREPGGRCSADLATLPVLAIRTGLVPPGDRWKASRLFNAWRWELDAIDAEQVAGLLTPKAVRHGPGAQVRPDGGGVLRPARCTSFWVAWMAARGPIEHRTLQIARVNDRRGLVAGPAP
jgi:hypothetical protein